ncbi:MAG: hypothetical protein JEY99_13430 [Spirochaetales bacterium]|nr:hypothetical protein [Spirochaetales bacterium]
MKKGIIQFIIISLITIFTLSGCGRNIIVISDEYWESYLTTGEGITPDWKAIVKSAGYKPELRVVPPDEEEWESLLKTEKPEYLLWGPLWIDEAYEFSTLHPDIFSLVMFPPIDGKEILPNISHFSPLKLEAYRETGEILAAEAGPEGTVVSIFYTGSTDRKAEYDAFLEGIGDGKCIHETRTFDRQNNFQSVLNFLNRYEDKNVSFLLIAAGGRTFEIRETAQKNISGRILVEIPDIPDFSIEENPSFMHYLWKETIISVLNTIPVELKREYDVPISINIGKIEE